MKLQEVFSLEENDVRRRLRDDAFWRSRDAMTARPGEDRFSVVNPLSLAMAAAYSVAVGERLAAMRMRQVEQSRSLLAWKSE